jgi:hypothetical protein
MPRTTQRYSDEERQFALNYGRVKLAQLRAEGVARVQILTSGDGKVCGVCKELDGKVFLIDDVPMLPLHEETEETWYICRCVFLPADGLRLSPRRLPRIAVTGLDTIGLTGTALVNAQRRIIERLRALNCSEHKQAPTSIRVELVVEGQLRVTVASCCAALHEPAAAVVGLVLRSRRR